MEWFSSILTTEHHVFSKKSGNYSCQVTKLWNGSPLSLQQRSMYTVKTHEIIVARSESCGMVLQSPYKSTVFTHEIIVAR